MNELTIIGSREIFNKEVNVFGTASHPLFPANLVAGWIDHSNVSKMLHTVPDTEKTRIKTPPNPRLGGLQANTEYWFVTERGLYIILMRSDKPLALEFQGKVADLLRDIRLGRTTAVSQPTGDELILAAMNELTGRVSRQKGLINSQQAALDNQRKQLHEAAPKVAFYDNFKYQKAFVSIGRLANILRSHGVKTGQNRLFREMRARGDVTQKEPRLTQKALDREIGQNMHTGEYINRRGFTEPTFRVFLNIKGIIEVFNRYNLSGDTREAVLTEFTKEELGETND